MRILTTLLILILGAAPAAAHISSISAATGTAGRGVSEPVENPYLNPAALAYQKGYYFGTGYAQLTSEVYGRQDVFSVALTDNMPDTVLPTSLAFTQSKASELGVEGLRRDFRLGIGNFYSGRTALGMAINYRTSKSADFNKTQLNAVLGAMFPLRRDIAVGLVFENFVASNSDLPVAERLDPNIALGVSYNYRKFVRLRADVISQPGNNFGSPILAVGLENYWNRWLIFRLGGQRDQVKEQSIESVGLGFAGPRFELQYAFQNIRGPVYGDARHSIDLGLPIW